jgi:polyhydroxyalkanoate synthesis regulator phasin
MDMPPSELAAPAEGAPAEGAPAEGEPAEGDVDVEEVIGVLKELVESGEITEDEAASAVEQMMGDPGAADAGLEQVDAGGEEVDPAEVEAALSELIEEGKISPDDVAAMLGEIESAAGGAQA